MWLIRSDLPATEPRKIGRCLSAGMGKLDGNRHRSPGAKPVEDTLHRRFGGIVIEPDIGIADPAFRHDGGCFDG